MVPLLNKLFNVRTDEWPRLLLLYLMAFLALTGINWGETIVEAAFLQQVGVQFLPYAFVANACFTIVTIFVYTAFADRVDNTTLLIGLMVISCLGIVAGLGFLTAGLVIIAFPLMYLILNVPLLDIYNVHWATYTNSFYDTRTAKRLIPTLGTSARLAGIVAGLTMPLLNRLLPPAGIILLWLGTLLAMAFIAWLMPRLLPEKKDEPAVQPFALAASQAQQKTPTHLENLREGYEYIIGSSFLRWMAVSTFLFTMLLAFINYRTSVIFLAQLKTTTEISNFVGLLNGITNILALPLQLFVLSRIITRLGLGNANLIFPVGTTFISGALVAVPNLFAAGLGYFDRTTFRTSFRNSIEGLLYNAVPLRVKGRSRAFIGGLVVPLATITGGILLLIPAIRNSWVLPAAIAVLSLVYLGATVMIRRQYTRALVAMLEQEDYSSLWLQNVSALAAADLATLNSLRKKLAESTSPDLTIFLAKLIAEIGGAEAVSILGDAARAQTDGNLRASILSILVTSDNRHEAAQRLFGEFLTDDDGSVRQTAVSGLEQIAGSDNAQFLAVALRMLPDNDTEVRAQVLLPLLRSTEARYHDAGLKTLRRMVSDPEAPVRAQGFRILGFLKDSRYLEQIVRGLRDPEDEVRLQAALAVEEASDQTLTEDESLLLTTEMIRLRRDPIERVREAMVVVLGRLGSGQMAYEVVASSLADPSAQVRTRAVDTLATMGRDVIPFVKRRLDQPDRQVSKLATMILSRLNRKEFGPLVDTQIDNNLQTIYRNYGRLEALRANGTMHSMGVLRNALQEENTRLLAEIFDFLAALHDRDAVRVIAESLNSAAERTRINAVEALESLAGPQTAGRIAPLYEPELAAEHLAGLSQETWDLQPPLAADALRDLVHAADEPLLRAITVYALGEIGRPLQADVAPQPMPKRDRPRRGAGHHAVPGNLLDNLGTSALTPPATEDTAVPGLPKLTRGQPLFTESGAGPGELVEIEKLLQEALADPAIEVRRAAAAATRLLGGRDGAEESGEGTVLSTIEKIIFLKEVPFFQGMTIDQLKVLATVCEEELFKEDDVVYREGDVGGVLYVVVNGRIGIEQERRRGSSARLATLGAHSYCGEMNLFDNSPHSSSAIALQDTLTLRLRREPLIALSRQHPDLSLELINVLSQRLREASYRIAELTRTRPRELHKLYDQFD